MPNQLHISNSTDPLNGKIVKEIRVQKRMKDTQYKKDRIKYDIVWQYMRDRNCQSVENIYKKYNGKLLHIIYKNDYRIHDFIYESIKNN